MATINISWQLSTDTAATTHIVSLADADMQRILAAAEAIFYPQGYPTVTTNTDGTETTTYSTPTGQQIGLALWESVMNGWLVNAQSHEKAAAAAAAAAAVQPISITAS